MAEIIRTNHRNKINREALLSKVCNLEKIALYYLNVKFKMELTGNEIKIDLNGKNIGNFDFGLLSQIPFKNAESINLSHNKISDLKPLEKLKFPQLKHLDLSFNKIEDLSPFKKYSKNEQKSAIKISFRLNEIPKRKSRSTRCSSKWWIKRIYNGRSIKT
jgi:Leucine-rich repeat (LRR) protein